MAAAPARLDRSRIAKTESDAVKLLLVDDSPENLVALEATLDAPGQQLVKATSGIEALRYLLEDDFAAILLDVRMPDMDGFETATLIRSRKRSRNTPILFLTGYKNEEHLFRGYDLGAVDFLFKPIVPEVLQSKVAVFVELSRNSILLRRQAEELRRAEASMRAVLEAAPEAMIIFDGEHRVRSVNTAAEVLFGHARSELIGRSMAELSPEWSNAKWGEPNELICATKTGKAFPAEVSLSPVETGEPGIVVSVIRDITRRKLEKENSLRITLELERQVAERTRELTIDIAERKRAEQALRESEQRLRVAIDAAQLGLWSIDLEKGLMQLSSLTAQMLNQPTGVSSISLAEWKDQLHAEDRARAAAEMERCIGELCDYESEYRVQHPDGSLRWIFARGQPFAEADRPVRIVGVAQDITHRRLAEEADRHRQKLESLGILAGGIAHDFNNLLTGILGNASLLLESASENSFEHQSLENLVGAAERAAELTRQMLAYSGRGKFVNWPISIGDEAREIATLVRASIPKHVRVQFDLEDGAPQVEGDKSQIQQLLMNLVINAAEAIGPEGGTVRISTHCERLAKTTSGFYPAEDLPAGNYLVLEVHDDGHGMTEATRARIFDPFFTTKFTGRGLGLAAVLGIVRGHRGGITVDSAPGAGTTFRIYLPANEKEGAADVDKKEQTPTAIHGEGTVLVVDDEPMVRGLVKSCLERYGYRVLPAQDGQEAMTLFSADPGAISLVLLDLAMPGMGGEETLRQLLAMRPEVNVIASSGYSELEAIERFGEGLAGFLQKPYSVRQLTMKVLSVLQKPLASAAG